MERILTFTPNTTFAVVSEYIRADIEPFFVNQNGDLSFEYILYEDGKFKGSCGLVIQKEETLDMFVLRIRQFLEWILIKCFGQIKLIYHIFHIM